MSDDIKKERKRKIAKVMREFKDGVLTDSHGNRVTDRQQAIAIAMSEAQSLKKSHVSSHFRRTPSGGVVQIKDYENSRVKRIIQAVLNYSEYEPAVKLNRWKDYIKKKTLDGLENMILRLNDFLLENRNFGTRPRDAALVMLDLAVDEWRERKGLPMQKSHVSGYSRRTVSGGVTNVKDYETAREVHKKIMDKNKGGELQGEGDTYKILPDGTWQMKFDAYEKRARGMDDHALRFTIKDAREAAKANPNGKKNGYYEDEAHVCAAELRRREKGGQMEKSHVKGYVRRTQSGAAVNVKEHEDSRTRKEKPWLTGDGKRFKSKEEALTHASEVHRTTGKIIAVADTKGMSCGSEEGGYLSGAKGDASKKREDSQVEHYPLRTNPNLAEDLKMKPSVRLEIIKNLRKRDDYLGGVGPAARLAAYYQQLEMYNDAATPTGKEDAMRNIKKTAAKINSGADDKHYKNGKFNEDSFFESRYGAENKEKAKGMYGKNSKVSKSIKTPVAPLLVKAHVKAYTKRTKSGKVVQVREHDDARKDHAAYTAASKLKRDGKKVFEGRKGHYFVPVYGDVMRVTHKGGKMNADFVNPFHGHGEDYKEPHYLDRHSREREEGVNADDVRSGNRNYKIGAAETALRAVVKHVDSKAMQKSHVKAHVRRTPSGGVAQVKEHEDSRSKKEAKKEKGRFKMFYNPYLKKDVPVYTDETLASEDFKRVTAAARELWSKRCKEHYEKNGDVGSCVLGAGITVDYMPPRHRTPVRKMIISQHDVARAQGSINWESSQKEIVKYFEDRGFPVHFAWGNLD